MRKAEPLASLRRLHSKTQDEAWLTLSRLTWSMHVGTPRGILRDTAASPKRTSNRSTLPPRSWMSGSRTRSSPALRARWILLARLLRALLEECNPDASNNRATHSSLASGEKSSSGLPGPSLCL